MIMLRIQIQFIKRKVWVQSYQEIKRKHSNLSRLITWKRISTTDVKLAELAMWFLRTRKKSYPHRILRIPGTTALNLEATTPRTQQKRPGSRPFVRKRYQQWFNELMDKFWRALSKNLRPTPKKQSWQGDREDRDKSSRLLTPRAVTEPDCSAIK